MGLKVIKLMIPNGFLLRRPLYTANYVSVALIYVDLIFFVPKK
jgi:hypothetical protein